MISSRGLFMCLIYIPFARLYALQWPMENPQNPPNPASVHYRDEANDRYGVTPQMASILSKRKVPIELMR
jgi:glycine cleavage system regulatory protein